MSNKPTKLQQISIANSPGKYDPRGATANLTGRAKSVAMANYRKKKQS